MHDDIEFLYISRTTPVHVIEVLIVVSVSYNLPNA